MQAASCWRLPHLAQYHDAAGIGSSVRDIPVSYPAALSIAHLYQAILNGEPHVPRLHHLTTLVGYVHWQLTGRKVLGVGDASGMFPIDYVTKQYDQGMLRAW